MKRTFSLILAAVAAAALFGGLVHAVLVDAHVSEPAATTVYGLTPRRLWATTVAVLALVGVVIGGLGLARPANRFGTASGRLGAIVALVAGLIAVVNGGLNLATANGGPGSGNGVVGGAAAFVLGLIGLAIGGLVVATADGGLGTGNGLAGGVVAIVVGLIGLALGGLALVALRRWRAAAWTLALPVLCLLPVYAYRAEVSTRLLWWTRRFVPVILPGLVVLVAAALAAGLTLAAGSGWWRRAVRAGSALALASLLVVFLSQSLPLRRHQEHGGSFETTQRIARAAGGGQGVFLWQQASGGLHEISYLFGGPVLLQEGQVSALLPRRPSTAYVRSFVRGFPGQPVFLVVPGSAAPRGYAGLGLRAVDRITYIMPVWEETYVTRPSSARGVPLRFSIWQVGGS
jgi:hypothetical protein